MVTKLPGAQIRLMLAIVPYRWITVVQPAAIVTELSTGKHCS